MIGCWLYLYRINLKTYPRKKIQKLTPWKKGDFMMNLTYLGSSGPRIDWSGTSTGRKLELKLENLHKSLFSGSLKPRLLKILIKVLTQQQIGLHTASSSMSDTLPLMMLTKVACRKIRLNRKNARKCTKEGSSDTKYPDCQYDSVAWSIEVISGSKSLMVYDNEIHYSNLSSK